MSTIHRGGLVYEVPEGYWNLGIAPWGTHWHVHQRAKAGEKITLEVLKQCAELARQEEAAFAARMGR